MWTGPVLASAGPDWKHFCGAPLSDVCRNFWKGVSSHNDINRWCERGRSEIAITPQFHLSSKDVSAVTRNKSMSYYSKYFQKGGIFCRARGYAERKSLQCQHKILFYHAEYDSHGRPTVSLVGNTLLQWNLESWVSSFSFSGKTSVGIVGDPAWAKSGL